jgi:hypothetical protein
VTKREARPLCHGFLRHAAEADSPGAVRAIPAEHYRRWIDLLKSAVDAGQMRISRERRDNLLRSD